MAGVLTQSHGSKVASIFPATISLMYKYLKSAKDADLSLKYECITSLSKALESGVYSLSKNSNDASTIKDLLKIAKSFSNDKMLIIRGASLRV